MNILQTSTGTFDISSPIKVAEYTATASTLLLVQLAASGLDGSGVNACLSRTIGATRYQTGVASQAGSAPYFPGMVMPVSTGDALGVWMEGQAADVAVAVRVEVWDAYAGSLAVALESVDAAGIRSAIGMAAADLDTQLAAVAKTGTDGDDLKSLSDQLDAIDGSYAGSGTGYYTDTIDDGTSPLDGVRVQLYTAPDRVGPAYEAYTNALGVFEMWPDPGTYYRWLDYAGVSFAQDVAVVVTEP